MKNLIWVSHQLSWGYSHSQCRWVNRGPPDTAQLGFKSTVRKQHPKLQLNSLLFPLCPRVQEWAVQWVPLEGVWREATVTLLGMWELSHVEVLSSLDRKPASWWKLCKQLSLPTLTFQKSFKGASTAPPQNCPSLPSSWAHPVLPQAPQHSLPAPFCPLTNQSPLIPVVLLKNIVQLLSCPNICWKRIWLINIDYNPPTASQIDSQGP